MAKLNVRKGVAALAGASGYKIERSFALDDYRLDVFDVVVKLQMTRKAPLRFLQVGANDGVFCDPIHEYVVRYGWSGVLLEPQPAAFEKLIENYKGSSGLEFVNAALSDTDGTAKLFTAGDGHDALGGFDARSVKRHRGSAAVKEITVSTISAKTLIEKYRIQDADLLLVDVEGFDCKIVNMLVNEGLIPPIIRFEHLNVPRQEVNECAAKLATHGYKMVKDGWDILAFRYEA
jgi:FkbM family methyltransferase